MTVTCLHCSAPARQDGGDYHDLCTQWPLCETRPGGKVYEARKAALDDEQAYRDSHPADPMATEGTD